jgi:hypothetical protein
MRPKRAGGVGQWFALAGAAVAIAVIVALILTWPDHGGGSVSATGAAPAAAKQTVPPAVDRGAPDKP